MDEFAGTYDAVVPADGTVHTRGVGATMYIDVSRSPRSQTLAHAHTL